MIGAAPLRTAASIRSAADRFTVAGVRITHPDRLIYPDLGISKIQLARYYESIGDWMVPHLVGRPLTLVHCPAGLAAPCRYLRHAKAWGPTRLRRVHIREKTKTGEYLIADDLPALVSLAQMGIVEIHTWNSTDDDVERPNRLVFDLDPGARVGWNPVVTGARLVRDLLHTLGLASWVKTTGGRGLHVVVPLTPARDWPACLAFSRTLAEAVERIDPARYTTAFSKRGREDKILVDYLRNNRTNTSVSAYSPRARPGAFVSMPLAWRDLKGGPERWTLVTVPARLKRVRADPWQDYWSSTQELSLKATNALRRL